MLDDIAGFLPGLTPGTAALAIAVCVAASILGGVSGFGAGLMITLFITPVVGPKAVLPMISVVMMITNASRVWFLRAALDLRTIAAVALIAVPASALGALVFVRLESAAAQALLGAVLILSIPARRWIAARKVEPGLPEKLAVGGVYGFLSSIVVGAGMLIIPLLMGMGLVGSALLATDAAIATIVSLARVIFFGGLDALTLPMFMVAAAMGLSTIPGTWLAAWIVRHTSVRIHTAFIEILVVVGGTGMIVDALLTMTAEPPGFARNP